MTDRILRRPEVEKRIGLSRSTIYAAMAEGTFPKPIRLGKRAVGWRQSDVSDWISKRERDSGLLGNISEEFGNA